MMNKYIITLLFFLQVFTVFSQELYFNVGKNFTSYSNASLNNLFISKNKLFSPGNSYELGVVFNQNENKLNYSAGINYNEFNTSYAVNGAAIRFDWETHYLGVQNSLIYTLYSSRSRESDFELKARLGLNTALFVYGNENANGINYNLKDNPDYLHLIFQPFTGLQMSYSISKNCKFNLGYDISQAKIGEDAGNSFNYVNQNVQAGLIFSLY
jgi:hypothetical protein